MVDEKPVVPTKLSLSTSGIDSAHCDIACVALVYELLVVLQLRLQILECQFLLIQ